MKHAFIILLIFTLSAASKEIRIAVGYSLPPYIIENENRGIELDIVREALKYSGHHAVPVYVPAARIRSSVEEGMADAAVTVNEASGIRGFFSDPHIVYQNVIISRSSDAIKLTKVSDAGVYSITAWQDAKIYMGEEYSTMASGNKRYSELADQLAQVAMLMAGRTDLIVIDRNIFHYFSRSKLLPVKPVRVTIHPLFPEIEYKVCFRDQTVRDDFNRGLARLKKSGRYSSIIQSYVGTPEKK